MDLKVLRMGPIPGEAGLQPVIRMQARLEALNRSLVTGIDGDGTFWSGDFARWARQRERQSLEYALRAHRKVGTGFAPVNERRSAERQEG